MSAQRFRSLPSLALFTLLSGSALLAHDDDPKILHQKPPLPGGAFSTGAFARGGGFHLVGAPQFASSNATLVARIPLEDFADTPVGNDCWGYVSPSGREYILYCHYSGTHFVDVTLAGDPVVVGYVPGPSSGWRDVKVYQEYAYVVSEGGDGIQVVDMTAIDSGSVALIGSILTGGGSDTHNVALDEESGFLYRCGGGFDDGLRIYDLADPANPVFVGEWHDRYVHDAQVVTYTSGPYQGKQIAFCCSGFNGGSTSTGVSILDVTDKSNIIHRGQVTWPGAAYSHQAWLSEDGQTLYVDDEQDEGGGFPTTIYELDVSDIDLPAYAGSFTNGNTAIGHNLYVKGDLLYSANYTSGLRVFDLAAGGGPTEIAWVDTSPDDDDPTFNGLWSTYPYLPSGIVAGSDKEGGLFLIWIGAPPISLTFPSGNPTVLDSGGDTVAVHIGEQAPGDYLPGSAKLFYDAGEGVVEVPLTDLGSGDFEASFGATPCGGSVSYYVTAQSASGMTWVEPPNGAVYAALSNPAAVATFHDDFDSGNGWLVGSPSDDAFEGVWERVDPNGTDAQPEDDHSAAGAGMCFVTEQGPPGGAPNLDDVDGGKTTLTSPNLDLSAPADYQVSYWRWYSNSEGIWAGEDVFTVEVTNDGSTWVNVETVGPDGDAVTTGWKYHQFNVADFVAPTGTVRVRFVASDYGGNSIVEAGVDDFLVTTAPCPDCDGNGISDPLEFATGVAKDIDGNGIIDACQVLSSDKVHISTIVGGTVNFALNGGDTHAGELYLLLGSFSGSTPGFSLGAVHIPLNQDVYFGYSLAHANQLPFVNTFSFLDAEGDGTAAFQLSPGFTSLIGIQAHHAWVAIHPANLQVTLGSNAMPLQFNF